SCRHSTRDDLDDRAGRGAGFAHTIEIIGPEERPRGVGAPERVVFDGPPVPSAAVDRVWADLNKRAADGHPRAENLAGDCPCRNTRSGLARRGAAAAAIVAHAVFLPVGVVGVTRTEAVSDVAIVPRALIGVLDHEL